MSNSGMQSTRVEVVPARLDPHGSTPSAEPDEPEEKLLRQPKVSFQASLPDWVLGGKPAKKGLLRAIWWLWARLSLYKIKWFPQPRVIWSYRAASAKLREQINAARHHSMAIITVFTPKGGATKTTISTWLAALLKTATHAETTILETDRGAGKVAKRFGFDPKKVLTVSAVVNSFTDPDSEELTYASLAMMTETDPLTGVRIVHWRANESVSQNNLRQVASKLKENAHTLVIDTMGGLEIPATNVAVAGSTVRVMVAKAYSDDDLDDIDEALTHRMYGLQNNLHTVVIALSGLSRYQCNTRQQYQFAARYGVKPAQVVLIPFNRYLRKTGRVRISALNARTDYALTQLAALVTTTAVATNSPSRHSA